MTDQDLFKFWFDYTPTTGVFLWRRSPSQKIKIGAVAGSRKSVYVQICVGGKTYYAHRMAWIYQFGDIPHGIEIDHKDTNKKNNAINNLRLVTRMDNMRNVGLKSTNKTGVKGVSWCRIKEKYRAVLGVGKKYQHIGYYDVLADAESAIREARIQTSNGILNHG